MATPSTSLSDYGIYELEGAVSLGDIFYALEKAGQVKVWFNPNPHGWTVYTSLTKTWHHPNIIFAHGATQEEALQNLGQEFRKSGLVVNKTSWGYTAVSVAKVSKIHPTLHITSGVLQAQKKFPYKGSALLFLGLLSLVVGYLIGGVFNAFVSKLGIEGGLWMTGLTALFLVVMREFLGDHQRTY